MIEDKFGNKDYTLIDHGIVDLVIDVPGQSLQYFQGQRDSNNSHYNTNLSIYSLFAELQHGLQMIHN